MYAERLEVDRIQRIVASIIATNPAGIGLQLVGGFRYRLLDNSERLSVDIDYHCGVDLDDKRDELLRLGQRVILGEIRRRFGYEGMMSVRTGPDADSANSRFLDLRLWKPKIQIEIPIELIRIICLDSPTIRTAEGVVHATLSEADLIESKIIAIWNRPFLQHRDLIDLFLYADRLQPDSPTRLKEKYVKLQLNPAAIERRLNDLEQNPEYHATAIANTVSDQMNPIVARQIESGGGGKLILDSALAILKRVSPI